MTEPKLFISPKQKGAQILSQIGGVLISETITVNFRKTKLIETQRKLLAVEREQRVENRAGIDCQELFQWNRTCSLL